MFALPAEALAQRRIVRRTYTASSASVSIIEAGERIGVRSIRTGQQDPALQQMAEETAELMARLNRGDHPGWEQRFQQLNRTMRSYGNFREIAAQSWPRQNEQAAAKEMFNSWRQSPGHWRIANGSCAIWGYSMARSRRGVWFGVGIVADRRGR